MSAAADQTSPGAAEQPRACARALVFVKNLEDSSINRQYYRVSTCGRYSVSKCSVAGKLVYDAWRMRGKDPGLHLGSRLSFEGAACVCQRHADENP